MSSPLIPSQIVQNLKLNDKFHLLHFQALDKTFTFQAGQFVVLKIGENSFRPYSVASSPQSLPFWELLVDTTPNGEGSKFIKSLKTGQTVFTTQPQGNFTINPKGNSHLVMGATGCGLAPIKSLLEQTLSKSTNRIFLLWGLRYSKEIIFRDLLDSWQRDYPHFKYQIVLSQEDTQSHITSPLTSCVKELLPQKVQAYLCGNSQMIAQTVDSLQEIGLKSEQIFFEINS